MSEALTVLERNKLAELEEGIQRHLDAVKSNFWEAGKLLIPIRDNELYKETHETFEEYCKKRWNISRPRAYQLMKAAEVQENLSTIVDSPINEAQARPLTKIKDPDKQREVYQKAVETAPEGKVTAKHVEETVRRGYKHTETHEVTDAMLFATMAISQLERIRQDDPERREGIRKVAAQYQKHA